MIRLTLVSNKFEIEIVSHSSDEVLSRLWYKPPNFQKVGSWLEDVTSVVVELGGMRVMFDRQREKRWYPLTSRVVLPIFASIDLAGHQKLGFVQVDSNQLPLSTGPFTETLQPDFLFFFYFHCEL